MSDALAERIQERRERAHSADNIDNSELEDKLRREVEDGLNALQNMPVDRAPDKPNAIQLAGLMAHIEAEAVKSYKNCGVLYCPGCGFEVR